MSEIRSTLAVMRKKRRKHDLDLMHVSPEQMCLPTEFTYETMMTGGNGKTTGANVRWMFQRRADHLEEHAIQIDHLLRSCFAVSRTQTHLIWAANQLAINELYASLTGLTDDALDDRTELPEDEWSLRQILEHIIVVERYYTMDCLHALDRYRAGEPHGELPHIELPIERPGASLNQLLLDMDGYREEALAALSCEPDTVLGAPARWGNVDVDVRFLMMRFGHHIREHTDHVYKWRAYTGRTQGEAARLLGLCWKQNGILEGHLVGAPEDILDQTPSNGDWPIRKILDHISSAETYFRRVTFKALG